MAQHACRPRPPRWARSTSGRPAARLRLFLRLPRRRDLAVGAAAGREHQPDRAAPRREIPPERGPGRQGGHLAAQAPRLRAGQAVLDVLGARRCARAAPHLQGMGRQVQRASSTTAGTRCASASSSARRSSAGFPADTKLTPRADDHGRRGTASRSQSGPSSGG